LIVRMSLVTGTATYLLEPVSHQSFFLETPTDQIEIRGPDTYFSRAPTSVQLQTGLLREGHSRIADDRAAIAGDVSRGGVFH
jgi:hypothetical protein